MKRIIIGVAGFARSGKDTFGDHLEANYGFKKVSFATPIKNVCRDIYDFSEEQLYGKLKEVPDERYAFSETCVICGEAMDWVQEHETFICSSPGFCEWSYPHSHITPRLAMQTLGTEWGRRLHSETWTTALFNMVAGSDHDRWVVCDVRFRNELHAIQDRRGLVVRLLRGEARHAHQSEQELTEMESHEFDHEIHNTGTLEDYRRMIDEFVRSRPEIPLPSPY